MGILSDYRLLNTRTLKSEWEYFQGSRIDFCLAWDAMRFGGVNVTNLFHLQIWQNLG